MITPEIPKENADTLLAHKDEILATRKLFEIHHVDPALSPEDILSTERIIILNFWYLTQNGKLDRNQYYALFQKCEEKKDFAELALMMRGFLVERAEKYLADHPDLPERGDALNPGKGNVESEIMWNRSGKTVIEKQIAGGKKVPIIDIGGPSFREIPDWFLIIKEQAMGMSDIYRFLESNTDGEHPELPEDKAVDAMADVTAQKIEKTLQ